MNMWLAVGMGGALGSMLRFALVRAATQTFGGAFPYGTLAVNVAGSFAAGLLYVVLMERFAASDAWRGLLLIGLLGGFTTFSAFSVETLRLLEVGGTGVAAANAALNLLLSLAACALGLWIGRQWI